MSFRGAPRSRGTGANFGGTGGRGGGGFGGRGGGEHSRACTGARLTAAQDVEDSNNETMDRRLRSLVIAAQRVSIASADSGRNGLFHARLRRRSRVRVDQFQDPIFQRPDLPAEQDTNWQSRRDPRSYQYVQSLACYTLRVGCRRQERVSQDMLPTMS